MSGYNFPVDIANKALQHLGAAGITTMTDQSKNAVVMNFAYDKIRQAALRRHLWRFSTRRQIIRPLDWTTMVVQPALWSATVSYLASAVVAYPLGAYWICRNPVASGGQAPSATNVDVYGSLVWDSYFGPLTAQAWNHQVPGQPSPTPGTTPSYNSGELAYLPFGNGSAQLFQCVQGTSLGPMTAEQWDNDHYYEIGQIVSWPQGSTFTLGPSGSLIGGSDALGNVLYQSTANLNIGNDPQLTQASGGAPLWNNATAYVPSDYAVGSDNQIYLCIANTTANDPVTDYANLYWLPTFMTSGMWQAFASTAPTALSIHWQYINALLLPITQAWPRGSRSWPLGTGPSSDSATSNVYRLPAGFMRLAPNDPKNNILPYLGGPSFVNQKDWVFEGNYMLSQLSGPVLLRFSADIQDVREMDPMFCEAFALELALHTAYIIGQKLPEAQTLYKDVIDAARTVDAIEQGTVTEPDDLLISVRA